jgi:hypothetical protein
MAERAGLEPKSAKADFHRGSAPLASLRSCHPDDVGKSFSHTLWGSNPACPKVSNTTERAGFEPAVGKPYTAFPRLLDKPL